MLDEAMLKELKKELPRGIKTVFISSVAGLGITELKDVLWSALNA
jgi:GTPase